MMRNRLQINFRKGAALSLCLLLVACGRQNSGLEYLETSMEMVEDLPPDLMTSAASAVARDMISKDGSTWFRGEPFKDGANRFLAENLYDSWRLVRLCHEEPPDPSYVVPLLGRSLKKGELTPIDTAASLCLINIVDPQEETEGVARFLQEREDPSGLLAENEGDDTETMICFTGEIEGMLASAGLHLPGENWKKALSVYADQSAFLPPGDQEKDFFESGGLASYARECAGIPPDREEAEWFAKWNEVFEKMEISSWDDLLFLGGEYWPVCQRFGAGETLRQKTASFVHKHLDEFLSEAWSSHLGLVYLEPVADLLEPSDLLRCAQKASETYSECAAGLDTPSPEGTFYGLLLQRAAGLEGDAQSAVNACERVIADLMEKDFDGQDSAVLPRAVSSAWYLALMTDQFAQGADSLSREVEFDKWILALADACIDTACPDPGTLLHLCELLGDEMPARFRRYLLSYTDLCLSEEVFLNSIYMITLYEIDRYTGAGKVTKEMVDTALTELGNGGIFRTEAGMEPDLSSTFSAAVLMSRFEEFTESEAYSVIDSAVRRAFFEDGRAENLNLKEMYYLCALLA